MASTKSLPMGSLSAAQHWNECDSAHLRKEMVQFKLSWCESVQWLQRYGFHKIAAQHWNECDSAHLLNEMLQLNLSSCESVQRLQRYGFCKIRTDGWTVGRRDARMDAWTDRCWVFYSPLPGSSNRQRQKNCGKFGRPIKGFWFLAK